MRLPTGVTAGSGDTVEGGGGEVPGSRLQELEERIKGDVARALGCAHAESDVILFNAGGNAMRVSPRN